MENFTITQKETDELQETQMRETRQGVETLLDLAIRATGGEILTEDELFEMARLALRCNDRLENKQFRREYDAALQEAYTNEYQDVQPHEHISNPTNAVCRAVLNKDVEV